MWHLSGLSAWRRCKNSSQGNRGFSLVELSVVLLIIAVVIGMAVSSGPAAMMAARESATRGKMKAIENALQAYRVAYGRIPCPADLTIAQGATNFGVEGNNALGTCRGGTPAANFSALGATNAAQTGVEGGVPVVTLGLPLDFAYDGWGGKIRYVVDAQMTLVKSFMAMPTGCVGGPITINDTSGTARTVGALYALISSGADQHGVYTKNGVQQSSASTNSNELVNCHCNSSGVATTYAPTYVQGDVTENPSSLTDTFDDIVSYKERWQMAVPEEDTIGGACTIIYFGDSQNYRIRKITTDTGIITTVGGTGTIGFSGDGGPATSAQIDLVIGLDVDSEGNIYFADYQNLRIRKIDMSTGIISTIAGTGTAGCMDTGILATSAEATLTMGVAVDKDDNVYYADNNCGVIKKIDHTTGIVTIIAGNGTLGYTGDGGPATSAENRAYQIAIDRDGINLYWTAYTYNFVIRRVNLATGIISTVAGTGVSGYGGDGGPALSAQMANAYGIHVDDNGDVVFVDHSNYRIRRFKVGGNINTLAGDGVASGTGDDGLATSARVRPYDIDFDKNGDMYIADFYTKKIRKVSAATGIITRIGGIYNSSGYSGDGGLATNAQVDNPTGIAVFNR